LTVVILYFNFILQTLRGGKREVYSLLVFFCFKYACSISISNTACFDGLHS